MKTDLVKKANEILVEIENLQRYKDFLNDRKQSDTVHFEIHQHFGDCSSDYLRIRISRKHTKRLLLEVDKIISELQTELDSL